LSDRDNDYEDPEAMNQARTKQISTMPSEADNAVLLSMTAGTLAYPDLAEQPQMQHAYAAFEQMESTAKMTRPAPLEGPERDRLLLENLATVRYLAHRIHERLPQHVELDDLVSAGIVGLIDAFNKFDHNKKVQFKSYAQFRIRGAILDSLRVMDWSPRELRRKGRAIQDAIHALTQNLRRTPTESEVAQNLNLGINDYQLLLGKLKGLEIGSLNMEHAEDSGEDQLAYIAGSPEEDPLFRCLQGEMRQHLIDAIDDLPEKERMVLTLYYYEDLTMKEIGLTLGVVESRVSQIHSSAVLRLRATLHGFRKSMETPRAPKRMRATRTDC